MIMPTLDLNYPFLHFYILNFYFGNIFVLYFYLCTVYIIENVFIHFSLLIVKCITFPVVFLNYAQH